MEMFNLRQLGVILVIISSMAVFCGCSDGGSSGNPVTAHKGVIVDSLIEGIDYETLTQNGTTDYQGRFTYQPGEIVSFYVGGVFLGSAQGESVISIVDLVDGASDIYHPVVTNIARFLQSLDEDEKPENGIRIAPSTINLLLQRDIDIVNPDMDFDNNIEIQNLLSEIGNIPVTAYEAQQHFIQFMNGEANSGCDDFPELIGSWKWIEEYNYNPWSTYEEMHTWEETLTFNPNCIFSAYQCTSMNCKTFEDFYQECTCTQFESISGTFSTTPDSVTIGDITRPYVEFTDGDRNLVLYKGYPELISGEIVYDRQ